MNGRGRPSFDDRAGHVIHQGDAASLPIEDGAIACTVTSPPYNVGIDYDGHDDGMPWDDYQALAEQACRELFRVSMEGARAWVNVVPVVPIGPEPEAKGRVPLLMLWSGALTSAGFSIRDFVSWPSQRNNGTDWGSWQRPSEPNLRGNWEAIIVAYKETWKRATPAEFQGWEDENGQWEWLVSNVWQIQPKRRTANGHPAPFPEEIAARAIRLSTWPGETVLDPFMGSGTTLRVAKDLGRQAIGVDVSESYCRQSAARLGQDVLFPGAGQPAPPAV